MALPFVLLVIFAHLSTAAPLSHQGPTPLLSKRASKSHKVGVGFGIAIGLIVFAAIVFYLGMRRGRYGTWYCWQTMASPNTGNANVEDDEKATQVKQLRTSIGFPKLERCTVPIELSPVDKETKIWELSPVEAKPKLLELPGEREIFEIGEKSPQKSWFEEIRSKRRSWFRSERQSRASAAASTKRSLYEMDGEPMPPPSYPEPARLRENVADGEGSMDWEGLEWMRKMYAERRSVHRPNP